MTKIAKLLRQYGISREYNGLTDEEADRIFDRFSKKARDRDFLKEYDKKGGRLYEAWGGRKYAWINRVGDAWKNDHFAMNEIVPNLWLGDEVEARVAPDDMAILCVLEQRPLYEPERAIHISVLQLVAADNRLEWYATKEQLVKIAKVIHANLTAGRKILVHCGMGMERAPLSVAHYLIWCGWCRDYDEAYKLLISKRAVVQRRDLWLAPENSQPTSAWLAAQRQSPREYLLKSPKNAEIVAQTDLQLQEVFQ